METVKWPVCSSEALFIEEVTETELHYCCEACGAKFRIGYPVPSKTEHQKLLARFARLRSRALLQHRERIDRAHDHPFES